MIPSSLRISKLVIILHVCSLLGVTVITCSDGKNHEAVRFAVLAGFATVSYVIWRFPSGDSHAVCVLPPLSKSKCLIPNSSSFSRSSVARLSVIALPPLSHARTSGSSLRASAIADTAIPFRAPSWQACALLYRTAVLGCERSPSPSDCSRRRNIRTVSRSR